ncbi:helix-turn-helix domain-containing protein [Crenothrix sp.]|uniref:helix-turn-helix domain-containing protein n=1 Tax=Crenothrix sp. TaxID=3100433 RepID=UPI00374CA7C7
MKQDNKAKQIDLIKDELLAGNRVDSILAFEKFHITRLAAIIKRLKDRGWQIESRQQHGNGIAEYSLPEGFIAPISDNKKRA